MMIYEWQSSLSNKMKKRLYIRVDGNKKIGFGHFFRCLALANFLRENFDITFISKELDTELSARLEGVFRFFKIEGEKEFFEYIEEKSIVIVDGYNFPISFFQRLKGKGSKIVSVQDVEPYSEYIDLVINHLPDVEGWYSGVEVLAGPKYAIIRENILRAPEILREEKNYFISLGGTKNYLLINRIISLIRAIDCHTTICILTTQFNEQYITGEKIKIFIDQDEEGIIDLIDNSRVCFITPGMISYEVLARNRKAVVGAMNTGQASIGEKLCDLGLVEYIGLWKDVGQDQFVKALKNDFNKRNREVIFDGKSDKRILNKFLQL